MHSNRLGTTGAPQRSRRQSFKFQWKGKAAKKGSECNTTNKNNGQCVVLVIKHSKLCGFWVFQAQLLVLLRFFSGSIWWFSRQRSLLWRSRDLNVSYIKVEGENRVHAVVLWCSCAHTCTHASTHVHTRIHVWYREDNSKVLSIISRFYS